MNKLLSALVSFYQEHPNPKFWLAFILWNAFCIALNYSLNFESRFISPPEVYQGWHFGRYFLFYGFAWFSALALYYLFYPQKKFFLNRAFIAKSFLILWIFTVYVNTDFFYRFWVYENLHYEVQYFVLKCMGNTVRVILISPLIYGCWWMWDRQHNKTLYGLRPDSSFDGRLYLKMFMVMVPLVVAASFSQDFLQQYPRYVPEFSQAEEFLGWKDWQTVLVFELCYGMDFLFIEWFFRGFIIFSLLRYVGSGVIFAMVTVYVFIHFEKPLGETIGSFWGGLILGVLSYKTQNLYGGIVVHLGVAWLMEAAAWAHRLGVFNLF